MIWWIVLLLAVPVAINLFFLRGADLRAHHEPRPEVFVSGDSAGGNLLLDDAVRYVNKARSQGSPVELQAWEHRLHVWHIFVREDMEEAAHAFDQIMRFMDTHGNSAEEAAA